MYHAPSQAYNHRPKDAVPGPTTRIGGATVKWYDLDEPANRITPQTRALARAALQDFSVQLAPDHAGFVILHQCSPSFAFLLISTWRGNNELWQSVHYIDEPLTAFAPFDPAYPPSPNLRPTFCVWELGVVAYEAMAWQRYLASSRSDSDLEIWHSDCMSGRV